MASPSAPVRLVAVGDIMLGDSAICVGYGFASRFPGPRIAEAMAALGPVLAEGDVVLGNLESPLTSTGAGGTRYRADQMRADPACAAALRALGFDALGVANNHAVQHGRAAFDETVMQLRSAGIAPVGVRGTGAWCADPVVLRPRSGARIGLLGYCWRPRQYGRDEPPFAEGTPADAAGDIARLRGTCDAVVVSLHWGEEFLGRPSGHEVTTARMLIEAGASVIVGHHPHVLRPVEVGRRGVIAYSLGNCVSDMIWQEPLRRGAVLFCTLHGGVHDVRVTPTRVGSDFRTVILPGTLPVAAPDEIEGLADGDYGRAVAATVRNQRLAAYAHAVRNLGRMPPDVLAELAIVTVWNKLAAVWRRGRARGECA